MVSEGNCLNKFLLPLNHSEAVKSAETLKENILKGQATDFSPHYYMAGSAGAAPVFTTS